MKNILQSVLLVTLLLNHHAVSAATLCGDTQIAYINSFVNGIINKLDPNGKFGSQALDWWSNFQNSTAHTYTADSLPNNTQADLITNGLTCCYPGQKENFELVIRAYIEAYAGPQRLNLLQAGLKTTRNAFNQCFPKGVPGESPQNGTAAGGQPPNNGTAAGGQPPNNGTAAGGQPPKNGTATGGQPPANNGGAGTGTASGANQPNGTNLGCPKGQLPSETGCQAVEANLLCPDGSNPSKDGCSFTTFKCPDNTTVPDQDGKCPATSGKCPDGSISTANGCPAACPDGSQPGASGCAVVVQPCKDGSTPASDGCPQECPGGLKPSASGCPSFTPKCSDGSDPSLLGCPARCLDGSIPSATQDCPAVPLNCPVLDIPPGPQGCPPKCADGKYKLPTQSCPTDASQPKCPDGSTVLANGCPQVCPDGTAPGNAGCTPAFKKCLDGSDPKQGCPSSCPDGSKPTAEGCAKIVPKCADGSEPAADGCPKLCPDRSIPDATTGCSTIVQKCKGPNGPTDPTNTGCPGTCPDGSPAGASGCPQICFDNSQTPLVGPCRRTCPNGKPVPPEGCKLPEIKKCKDNSTPTALGCPQAPEVKFCFDGSLPDAATGKCPQQQAVDVPQNGTKTCAGDAPVNADGKCPLDVVLGNVDKAQKNLTLGQNKLVHQYARSMSRIFRGVLPVLCSDPDAPNKAYINADGTLIINEADQAKAIDECTTSLNNIFNNNFNDLQTFVNNSTNLQLKATGDQTACTTINTTIVDTFKSLNPCNGDCKSLCTDYFSIFSSKILEEVITKSNPDAGTNTNSQLRRRLAGEYTTSATGGMSAYNQDETAEGSIEVQGANSADLQTAADQASKEVAANPVDYSAANEIAEKQGDQVQTEINNSVLIQSFGLLLMIVSLLI